MILFNDKSDCCNCGSCQQACPVQAISTITDEYGFKYPTIDHNKCIDCGLCQKVCAYQHIAETNSPLNVYVATSNNKLQIKYSASGGIFATLATYIITNGGIAYGAAMERDGDKFIVRHKSAASFEDLKELQGSKYIQSDIGTCFKEIRTYLTNGKLVLFSGTPCQCAGLKAFLRKDYPNLYIVDIICHGVPSLQFFNDYIDFKFHNLKNISDFSFRNKSSGWELKGCIKYDGGNKQKYIIAGTSSYYSLFLDAQIYRTNCYSCKYACNHRPGDLTIGDYWGVQREHPELIGDKRFNIKDGISCVITNTSKGETLLANLNNLVSKEVTTYEKVARRNAQLLHPSKIGRYRKQILKLYHDDGYKSVDALFKRNYKSQIIVHRILNLLPYHVKNILRRIKHL